MGFFDKIFGSDKEKEEERWYEIRTTQEMDNVILASSERPQVILKHSNSCGVSFFAKQNLDSIPSEKLKDADLYIIDVIRYRDVSYYLADKFNIRHESPQVFVIRDKEVVWNGSHGRVSADNVIQSLTTA